MPKKSVKTPVTKSRRGQVSPYSPEIRNQAVRLMVELGYSPQQIAQKFGCAEDTARDWREKFRQTLSPEQAGNFQDTQEEMKCLKKENARLKEETEILKKAAALYFRNTVQGSRCKVRMDRRARSLIHRYENVRCARCFS